MEDIPGKGFSHMCKQYKRYSRRFFGSFHRLRRYQDIKINTEVEQTVEDMVIPEASEEVKQEENK